MSIYKSTREVPSPLYTKEYFLDLAGGGSLFLETNGSKLDPRTERLLDFIPLNGNTHILDVGCGRGELLKTFCKRQCSLVAGIDYAEASIEIASQLLQPEIANHYCMLQKASATNLPYCGNLFDFVTMADVVEHLYHEQLAQCLTESYRVLKTSGTLLIHTFPNRLCWDYGYPILRRITNVFRKSAADRLPENPRTDYDPILHVNEQTPGRLRRSLLNAGFKTVHVWVELSQITPYLHFLVRRGSRKRELAYRLISAPGLREVFFNDIYAIAVK